LRIAVVGALNMDLVARVPRRPERGESLAASDFRVAPGGKGCNQAVAAARLGAEVAMIGRVGVDDFGRQFLDTLAVEGIDSSFVVRDEEEGTGIAMPVVFDDGGNSIIYAPRANLRLTVEDVERGAAAIEAADMLLLQLEVPPACNLAAASIAARAGRPVMLTPAPAEDLPEELANLAAFLVPNQVEAAMLTRQPSATPEEQADMLYREGMAAVLVTLGEQGCVAATAEGIGRFPAFEVEAVDTVGAGDAFCAGLAVATIEGRRLDEAVRFASAVAAISVTRRGASQAMPGRAEVETFLGERA
jgi:ribokinase